ncbi:MAG: 2-hydroxyacid dehydrogenase [Kiritimatiellae bacterium]|nr:2-hydroxyacid dehydrogenase [Kiritimatiellia bacterium]
MKKLAFFDTKPYDRESFDRLNGGRYDIRYFETRLTAAALPLADGCDAACAFVNAEIDRAVVEGLVARGIKVLAMRCAGYNNVDFKAAWDAGLTVVRVPAYSPYAVAEHAAALLLSLVRHIHRAAARTRDFNFSLAGLTGFDLHGKTAGIVGTGKIGRIFAGICQGFGMRVLAYDAFPNPATGLEYVDLGRLWAESDVVSLHCPLLPETRHIVDAASLARMKRGVVLVNTSRGGLVDSDALLAALRDGAVGAAGLDVYEEESDWFYEDRSDVTRQNKTLSLLVSLPNVIVTSHQAFLTREALANIASTTFANLDAYFSGGPLENEICYRCSGAARPVNADCPRRAASGRCRPPRPRAAGTV